MIPSSPRRSRPLVRLLPTLAAVFLVAACGGGGTEVEPVAPVIEITGVEDGAVLQEAVTIGITVEGGTFEAILNGEPFFSGSTVSEPGSYELVVTARRDGLTSTATVRFELRLGGASTLVVRFLDLGDNDAGGGGDAILLADSSAAGQRWSMIDAGPAGAGGSDLDFVADRLADLGVDTLQVLLLTHAHSDHFDGMTDILESVVVEQFLYNGQARSFSRYNNTLDAARARAGEVVVPDEVLEYELGLGEGPAELTVLPSLPTFLDNASAESSEINEGSLGVALDKGGFRIFFTGDGEVEANRRWRTDFPTLTQGLDALKVGHHGANDAVFDDGSGASSDDSAWLDHAAPELHFISANGSTHPRIRALSLLHGQGGSETYCTNVHGDIELRVNPEGRHTVSVERNAAMDCVPGDDATT